jgi:apolipoprotein N-acyltransferase
MASGSEPRGLPRRADKQGWAAVGALGAVAGTALLLRLGTGLHPHPLATWAAFLPILLWASRSWSGPASIRPAGRGVVVRSGLLACLAYALGTAGLWSYGRTSLELPPPVLLGYVGLPALVFGLVVAWFGQLGRRGHPLAAVLWVPAAWVGVDYLISIPVGTFLSLSATQAGLRPVLDIAALTGGWGITFLLVLGSTAVAGVLGAALPTRTRTAIAVIAVVPLLLGLAYGSVAASRPPSAHRLRVALLALPQPAEPLRADSPAGARLLAAYAARVAALGGSGAQIAVLPEKVLAVGAADEQRSLAVLGRAGHSGHVAVVIGLSETGPAGLRNVAVLVPLTGEPVTYAKQRLVPGLESDYRAGDGTPVVTEVDGVRIRLLVCRDLDFPQTVRAGGGGADLLLAPSWDFADDGWLHSRIAVLRAVENGVSLARPARDGRLTASDETGRVIAERSQPGTADGTATGSAAVVADLPLPDGGTPYARFGDWMAWLCLLVAAVSAVSPLRRTRRRRAVR